jgi:hypothetical protein
VRELYGPKNCDAPREIWLAAHRWLASQPAYDLSNDAPDDRAAELRANWQALWRPYWIGKRTIPRWLSLGGSTAALYYL